MFKKIGITFLINSALYICYSNLSFLGITHSLDLLTLFGSHLVIMLVTGIGFLFSKKLRPYGAGMLLTLFIALLIGYSVCSSIYIP